MKKSIFFISLILTIIISFAAGYFIGQTPLIDKEKIVQQTKEEIKNRLIEAKIINPEPEQILSLSGTVKEVGENYIVVVPSMRQNPFGDIFPGMVKILTNEGTKIEKWTLKSPEEYEKEKFIQDKDEITFEMEFKGDPDALLKKAGYKFSKLKEPSKYEVELTYFKGGLSYKEKDMPRLTELYKQDYPQWIVEKI